MQQILPLQKLQKGTAEYDIAFNKLKSKNKIGSIWRSVNEVIELGSSALTAKNLVKLKARWFFGKTVATTDNNGNKNNSPITSTSSVLVAQVLQLKKIQLNLGYTKCYCSKE